MSRIAVLDKGYVRVVAAYGSDLTIVNAARASFLKESAELTEKDKKLIRFLARNKEMSPFRHALVAFEIKAPLLVARQWWKYVVGSDHTMETAWNEASYRYVTLVPDFYIPNSEEWRSAPDSSKQGSGEPIDPNVGAYFTEELVKAVEDCVLKYEEAIRAGVAPEQARLFLNAYGMYVTWRWTASLQALVHFWEQRLSETAQYEIRQYAKAVRELVEPCFPVAVDALTQFSFGEFGGLLKKNA